MFLVSMVKSQVALARTAGSVNFPKSNKEQDIAANISLNANIAASRNSFHMLGNY